MPASGAEVELERMVARIILENSDYIKSLRQTVEATATGATQIESRIVNMSSHWKHFGDSGSEAMDKMRFGFRDMRHSIHLLSAVSGAEGIARPAMMGFYAWHILEKTIHGVKAALGGVGLLMTGIAGAAAVAALGLVYHWWEESKKVIEETKKATEEAFGAIAKGGQSIGEAMNKEKIEETAKILQESLKDFQSQGGFWNALLGTNDKDFGATIARHKKIAEEGREIAAEHARTPEVAAEMREHIFGSEKDKAEDMRKKRLRDIETFGMSPEDMAVYDMADRIYKAGKDFGISKEEAKDKARENLRWWIKGGETLAQQNEQRFTEETRARTRLIGMTKEEAAIEKHITSLMLGPQHMSRAKAEEYARKGGARSAIVSEITEQERLAMDQKERSLKNELQLSSLGEYRAKNEKIILDYMMEHVKATRTEAEEKTKVLRATQDQITVEQLREKLMTPAETYAKMRKDLEDLRKRTPMTDETYKRALSKLAHDYLDLGKMPEKVTPIAIGPSTQAEALFDRYAQETMLAEARMPGAMPEDKLEPLKGIEANTADAKQLLSDQNKLLIDQNEILEAQKKFGVAGIAG